MRVAALSDLHLGTRRYGRPEGNTNSRVVEARACLDWFVDLIGSEQVDIALWCGDTLDTRRPGPADLRTVADAVARISRICPLVVVGGNHDGPSTVGDVSTHTLGWLAAVRLSNVWVATEPSVWRISTQGGPCTVFAHPYPHSRSLDGQTSGSANERMAEVGRQTAERIRDWGTTSHNTPTLFVGHLSVAGASLGAERMMRVGFDVTVPATCLDGFDAALLGHIHKRQPVWRNAWYCGSPMAHDWSEEGQAKGALVVDVERGILPIVRAVDFPARPVRTIRLRYVASEQYEWPKEWPAGAMVRVIVDAERRPDAAWKARLEREALEAGCHYVRVDVEVRASQKQESGPTTTVGPEERLRSWLREHHVTEGPALEAARQIWQGASR